MSINTYTNKRDPESAAAARTAVAALEAIVTEYGFEENVVGETASAYRTAFDRLDAALTGIIQISAQAAAGTQALEELVAAKIPISVCVSPTLPIEDPERYAQRIAALKPVWVSVQKFHKSDRPFTSDTRPEAFGLAKDAGWTDREFNKAVATMRKHLPNLKEGRGGFLPA